MCVHACNHPRDDGVALQGSPGSSVHDRRVSPLATDPLMPTKDVDMLLADEESLAFAKAMALPGMQTNTSAGDGQDNVNTSPMSGIHPLNSGPHGVACRTLDAPSPPVTRQC